jgi:exopolysaccharide production protein ExoY
MALLAKIGQVPVASIPILSKSVPRRTAIFPAVDFAERLSALVLLSALSPVLCLSAATVALLSRRSPFIAHRRVGWRGTTLWMLKLRTMWSDGTVSASSWVEYIDDPAGPQRKEVRDTRVPHAFARFCRRHSIDELPQLLHVIRGEMSLVGPRPLTAGELRRYYGADAEEVLAVKPGLAGLWQISGRNRLTYAERLAFDLRLVRTLSLALYFRILCRTVAEVWTGRNSW